MISNAGLTLRRLLGASALLLAIAAGGFACSGNAASPAPTASSAGATDTPVAATATAAAPAGTATPDPALLRDGGVVMIQTAFVRLMDEYINPLNSADLLAKAWTGLRQEAGAEGMSIASAPAFTGDRTHDFAEFEAAYVAVAAQAADATKLRYAAISSMASSLNDCHTFFLNPVASTTLVDTRSGAGAVGIGIELSGIPPAVTEVIQGGPAERAGLRLGDRIVAVDATDTSGVGPRSAFDLINGREGTIASLTVRRAGEAAPLQVAVTRERVTPANIETRVLGGGIGYVRVRNFVDTGIAAPLREVLTGFELQGVTKWIIDLRDDPGGREDTNAMSLFVPEGVLVRSRFRDRVDVERATGATLPVVRPTVLLADNRTGSVAELFAAGLQEYGVAHVIGQTTNGCVGFTNVQPLGDGSSLAVTVAVNLGPVSGRELAWVGVVPDEAVGRSQSDIENGRDPQLDAAVGYFGG